MENSPRTSIKEVESLARRQDYREAIASLLPGVSAQTRASYNFGRSLDEDNTYKSVNSFDNNYQLYASLNIFNGFSAINRIRMEKVNRIVGAQQLRYEQDMVAYETMGAFFNVLYYKETVTLAAQQLEASSANLRQTQRMADLGIKGFPDVAEMEAQEALDRYKLTQQNNMLAIGVILLKEKMNFPIDEQFDIADSDVYEADAAEHANALRIYESALEHNPKALAAQSEFRASELSYKITRGRMLPSLSMEAGISTNFFKYRDGQEFMPYLDQLKGKRGEYFGFTLSIPIFNGLARKSATNRSRYQMEIARYEQDQTLRSLYSEIEQAVADVKGHADEYMQARRLAQATRIAHEVNQRKYEQGLISALELHTSANRSLDAQVQLKNSSLLYNLKLRLLNYYKGEPLFTLIDNNN